MGYLSPKLSYMNLKAKLGSREFEVLECIAWGASQKETASFLGIALRTVDNTVRKIKLKTGLQKAAELSAYFFCGWGNFNPYHIVGKRSASLSFVGKHLLYKHHPLEHRFGRNVIRQKIGLDYI